MHDCLLEMWKVKAERLQEEVAGKSKQFAVLMQICYTYQKPVKTQPNRCQGRYGLLRGYTKGVAAAANRLVWNCTTEISTTTTTPQQHSCAEYYSWNTDDKDRLITEIRILFTFINNLSNKIKMKLVVVLLREEKLYGCIKKLVHPPITTRYKFDLNETIRYPALTFCRRPAYKTALFPNYGIRETAELTYDNTFRHFPFKNTTIKQFLTATTYNLQELGIYGFGGEGMSDNVEKRSTFILSRGLCHTLIPKQNSATFSIAGGYLLYFKHDTMNTVRDSYGQSMSGFEIFLHDPNEIVTDPDEQINSFQEFIYLETSEDMHVRLMVEIFNQISTTNEPCVIKGGYSRSKCQQNCLHRQIAAKARCTLPWLRLSDDSWPQCSDYQSVRTLITGFNPLNQSHFLKNCNCRMACNLTIYTSHIMTRRQADNLTRPGSIINLYFASNLIKQMDEAISYDFNLFLSDVGGSLGFFLGLSVIGILTIIEEIVQICSDDDKNRKNTKFFDYLTDYQTNNKIEKY